jgi:hypothetical protein
MKTLLRAGAALAAIAAFVFLLGCEDSLLLDSLKVDKHRTVILTDTGILDLSASLDNVGPGNIYVAWKNLAKQVRFVRSSDKGAIWGTAVDADASSGQAGRTRIIGGTASEVVIVHKHGAILRCATSINNGSTWSYLAPGVGFGTLDSDDSKNNFALAATGSTPILIYNDTFGDLKAFSLSPVTTPGAWAVFPATNTISFGGGTTIHGIGSSLAADQSGKLYAGFLTNRSPGGSSSAAFYNGTAWSSQAVQGRGQEVPNGDTAIGFGNGKIYLAYAWEPSHQIWLAQGGDIFSQLVNSIYTGLGPISSVRVAVPGSVHVAFFDEAAGSIMLIYSHDSGVTWSAPVTVEDGLDKQEFGFFWQAAAPEGLGEALCFFYKVKSSDGVRDDLVFSWIDTNDLP